MKSKRNITKVRVLIILVVVCANLSVGISYNSEAYKQNNNGSSDEIDDLVVEIIEQINETMYLGYLENIVAFGPRYTGTLPCHWAGDYILNEFQNMGLEVRCHNWSYSGFSDRNIEGTLPGINETSDEIYIICAHYDTVEVSPGADDDGSGVAAILSAALIMSQYNFEHTIRFIAFSGEEQGLYGSKKYVEEAFTEGENIIGVLNADMIGYHLSSNPQTIRIFQNYESQWLAQFTELIGGIYHDYIGLDIWHWGDSTTSDHESFWEYGYAAIHNKAYRNNPYGHTSGDTIDKLNISYATLCSKLIIATLAELAQPAHDFIINLENFPMYEAEPDPGYNEMCGPAVAQMALNYIWWNISQNETPPMTFDDQTWLYNRGIENNSNTSLPYLDARGLWYIIQYNKPMPYSEYGYNFMKYNNEDLDAVLKRICLWINYTVGSISGGHKPGHPYHVPTMVPTYGDYTNWMAIRGFHADKPAFPMPDNLTVYGFWVNDPLPSGIGENSYKNLEEAWLPTYYKPINVTDDPYYGKYVAILEPPETNENAQLTIASSPTRFNPREKLVIKHVQSNMDTVSESLITRVDRWVIQAAIDGVTEQLIPYDDDFAAVFKQTIPGEPLFVKNIDGNNYYYAVLFNIPSKPQNEKPIIKPKTTVGKQVVIDAKTRDRIDNSIIAHDDSEVIDEEVTMVVILIDAEDGSFKEASWVKTPVKYLPISREEALKIASKKFIHTESGLEELKKATAELVYKCSSPYYPAWEITINGHVYYVNQDGEIGS